jgi:hypothetical protein
MNRSQGLRFWLMVCAVTCLAPGLVQADPQDDMRYWGYSSEIIKDARKAINDTHVMSSPQALVQPGVEAAQPQDEATAVQQQLTELGRTRSLHPETPLTVVDVKHRLDNYWDKMGTGSRRVEGPILSSTERDEIVARIQAALESKGYSVGRLELIDTPANLGQPQARAWIRAARPLKTKDPYREAQTNLAEIKTTTLSAATKDGICPLSEMTIFIAEDPRSRNYYEKTILLP